LVLWGIGAFSLFFSPGRVKVPVPLLSRFMSSTTHGAASPFPSFFGCCTWSAPGIQPTFFFFAGPPLCWFFILAHVPRVTLRSPRRFHRWPFSFTLFLYPLAAALFVDPPKTAGRRRCGPPPVPLVLPWVPRHGGGYLSSKAQKSFPPSAGFRQLFPGLFLFGEPDGPSGHGSPNPRFDVAFSFPPFVPSRLLIFCAPFSIFLRRVPIFSHPQLRPPISPLFPKGGTSNSVLFPR